MSWLNETIEKELKAIEDSKGYPEWFSHDVITNLQKLDQKLSDDFIGDVNPERGEDGFE